MAPFLFENKNDVIVKPFEYNLFYRNEQQLCAVLWEFLRRNGLAGLSPKKN
jgi:hypothetical protein